MFGSALDFLANLLGLARRRQDLVNSPEMQRREAAQREADRVSEAEKAVETRDTDSVRRGLAE